MPAWRWARPEHGALKRSRVRHPIMCPVRFKTHTQTGSSAPAPGAARLRLWSLKVKKFSPTFIFAFNSMKYLEK